jgi:hypothetical protein
MIGDMPNLQPIKHCGRLAAVVVAGQAIIDDVLPDEEFRHVEAMCLYALELAEDRRAHTYTDQDADAYAHAALSPR